MTTEPKLYRHRPTQIRAAQFDPSGPHKHELPRGVKCMTEFDQAAPDWQQHGYHRGGLIFCIGNDKGWIKVVPGDWVVYGSRGEIYPVASGIFEDSYEAVDS